MTEDSFPPEVIDGITRIANATCERNQWPRISESTIIIVMEAAYLLGKAVEKRPVVAPEDMGGPDD